MSPKVPTTYAIFVPSGENRGNRYLAGGRARGSRAPERSSRPRRARPAGYTPPGTYASVPEADTLNCPIPVLSPELAPPSLCITLSTTTTGSEVGSSRSRSKGTAIRAPWRMNTRWPVGRYRGSLPPVTTTLRSPVSSRCTTMSQSLGTFDVITSESTALPPAGVRDCRRVVPTATLPRRAGPGPSCSRTIGNIRAVPRLP
jgi:hypothetical protein